MTDLRALCAELTDALHELNCGFNIPSRSALIERARAALAEPTDEQLLRTYALALTLVVDDAPKPWPDDLINRAQIAGFRAVLARWGNYPGSPDSSTSPCSKND